MDTLCQLNNEPYLYDAGDPKYFRLYMDGMSATDTRLKRVYDLPASGLMVVPRIKQKRLPPSMEEKPFMTPPYRHDHNPGKTVDGGRLTLQE
jgi:hypothetical protein